MFGLYFLHSFIKEIPILLRYQAGRCISQRLTDLIVLTSHIRLLAVTPVTDVAHTIYNYNKYEI